MFRLESGYVKPLHIIWSKCPIWSAQNTLIVDDLERNFVLNPQAGVLVSGYYRHPHRHKTSKPSHKSTSVGGASVGGDVSVHSPAYHSSPNNLLFPMASSPSSSTSSTSASASSSVPTEDANASQEEIRISEAAALQDKELFYLSRYLVKIAHLQDLSVINHSNWRKDTS
eukprot:CAMPEP_0119037610 /NCGR_PEP_ID=MMETSP1177-20130426/6066_1 /TAXON_ID=2985 /ORGANISM="Ochromonas sp, Strain CCMP1899" /LENGTH=169 /DNA_ID=CAMNT_0006999115 /DNA_START=890 /DNA_END=1399 /DNA_ORIENTATION=-